MALRRLALPIAALVLVWSTASTCGFFSRPRLVVLLTVDTLRADHLGAYGSRLGLTPHLDRLATESTVFTTAYAPTSFTLPSLSALMTSRYPEEVGIDGNSAVLSREAVTLPDWLSARGWRTAAVVSNYVLRPSSGFDRGFGRYDATFPQREAVRPVPERVAPDTTAAALKMMDDALAEGRQPLFLWVHYQDPHGPYAPPEPLRARHLDAERAAPDGLRDLPLSATQTGFGAIPRYQHFEGHSQPAFYRAGYKGEVSYVDQAIGTFLDGLRARGLLEATTVLFAADHGEGMGEDDYWFGHGEMLTDPLVRVPLFVHRPGQSSERRDDVASLLDVFPTLAVLTDGSPPPGLRGRDLLAPGAASHPSTVHLTTLKVASLPRQGIVARGHKYLVAFAEPPREQLFRLGEESRDVAPEEPEALADLRKELAAARKALRVAGTRRQVLSPEEIEKLKSLGYVEGN